MIEKDKEELTPVRGVSMPDPDCRGIPTMVDLLIEILRELRSLRETIEQPDLNHWRKVL